MKPKVFVSSTLHDFRDLRPAIKFWLEEFGYEVRLSEFNDFEKRPDMNAFDACFESIKDCDYYILLIGEKKGSWYSESDRISVTQAEYQTAYEQTKRRGTLKIIAFARRNVIEKRKVLEECKTSLSADDAFIFHFIDEVRREAETRASVRGEGPPPGPNWLHQFDTFRDITDVLKASLRVTGNLRRRALEANLIWELKETICRLSEKGRKGIRPHYVYLSSVRQEVKLGELGKTPITVKQLGLCIGYTISILKLDLPTYALQEAITSGEFLEFDQHSDSFVPGKVQEMLLGLRTDIENLRVAAITPREILTKLSTIHEASRHREVDSVVSVNSVDLGILMRIHDLQKNIIARSAVLLRYFGRISIDLEIPHLSSGTPWTDMAQEMEEERVAHTDVDAWIRAMKI